MAVGGNRWLSPFSVLRFLCFNISGNNEPARPAVFCGKLPRTANFLSYLHFYYSFSLES